MITSRLAPGIVALVVVVVGFVYLEEAVRPVLEGHSYDNAFVGDVFLYMTLAQVVPIDTWVSAFVNILVESGINFINFSLFGIVLYGAIIKSLFGEYLLYGVFAVNSILVFWIFFCISRIVSALSNYSLQQNENTIAIILIVLGASPIFYPMFTSLNKDIFGYFFLTYFIKALLLRQYTRMIVAVLFSTVIRDVYFFTGVLFIAMNILPIARYFYLILISLVAPFILSATALNTPDVFATRSSSVFTMLYEIDQTPLGYAITYVPKLLWQLFAAGNPQNLNDISLHDFYGSSLTISSLTFIGLFTIYIFRKLLFRYEAPKILFDIFFAYTFVSCLVPYSQHRLFTPLLVVCATLVLLPSAVAQAGARSYEPRDGSGVAPIPLPAE